MLLILVSNYVFVRIVTLQTKAISLLIYLDRVLYIFVEKKAKKGKIQLCLVMISSQVKMCPRYTLILFFVSEKKQQQVVSLNVTNYLTYLELLIFLNGNLSLLLIYKIPLNSQSSIITGRKLTNYEYFKSFCYFFSICMSVGQLCESWRCKFNDIFNECTVSLTADVTLEVSSKFDVFSIRPCQMSNTIYIDVFVPNLMQTWEKYNV